MRRRTILAGKKKYAFPRHKITASFTAKYFPHCYCSCCCCRKVERESSSCCLCSHRKPLLLPLCKARMQRTNNSCKSFSPTTTLLLFFLLYLLPHCHHSCCCCCRKRWKKKSGRVDVDVDVFVAAANCCCCCSSPPPLRNENLCRARELILRRRVNPKTNPTRGKQKFSVQFLHLRKQFSPSLPNLTANIRRAGIKEEAQQCSCTQTKISISTLQSPCRTLDPAKNFREFMKKKQVRPCCRIPLLRN